jgi:hypothetical protein
LKSRNEQLRDITAGVLGKQLNFQDARMGLLHADLEEKERDIKELKRKQSEMLKAKEEENQRLIRELRESRPSKYEEDIWRQKYLQIEKRFEDLLKVKEDELKRKDRDFRRLEEETDNLRRSMYKADEASRNNGTPKERISLALKSLKESKSR